MWTLYRTLFSGAPNQSQSQPWCCRPYPATASEVARYLPQSNEEIRACLECLRRRSPAIAIARLSRDSLDPGDIRKRKGIALDCDFAYELGARPLLAGQYYDELPDDGLVDGSWTFSAAERSDGTNKDQLPDALIGPLNERLQDLGPGQNIDPPVDPERRPKPPILWCHMKKDTKVVVGDDEITYRDGKRHSIVVLLRRTSSSLSERAARVGIAGREAAEKAGMVMLQAVNLTKRKASGKS